ncbi:TetR/AcrR family transcriptional regulator [Mesorhizobium sp. M3A.F.Ca.ET.080.04.2.1]|uniref:helix-turn-helix domain-containing protein n=1 Tax=Mesorhizobium sp. M3A.F.Ca.ET.080.04.2.1 TaxID=2493676 RepID=UPI000F753131|nr:helix-turn-helix domain-containing protein [Mesorhizobium sp. M3A.F.Ca.ET.080.04.2.1]AZO07998.1 TetR/AcrR family transcriptional regulator [Mesorhizobium sp. M3A.F.Ca.ET.080.04.2.1]
MARFQTAKKAPPPLPAELRDAAIALFAEFGYAATGIREIARRTGLSSAAMYHYLRSKQDLLFELMYDSMQDQFSVARAALERAGPARPSHGLSPKPRAFDRVAQA